MAEISPTQFLARLVCEKGTRRWKVALSFLRIAVREGDEVSFLLALLLDSRDDLSETGDIIASDRI